MAIVQLEDLSGGLEAIVFPKPTSNYQNFFD